MSNTRERSQEHSDFFHGDTKGSSAAKVAAMTRVKAQAAWRSPNSFQLFMTQNKLSSKAASAAWKGMSKEAQLYGEQVCRALC